tara:strand:- start:372 stop:548 length:177 start_codon:yes stop_codon:yes gene_type:complete
LKLKLLRVKTLNVVRYLLMPKVGKKKFAYTPKGKAAAKKAAKGTPTPMKAKPKKRRGY